MAHQKKFNRYDALLAELHRLQLSKLKLLQAASMEMQKLRTFIRFLCQIDQEKQISSAILTEIDRFNTNNNNKYVNDESLSNTIETYYNDKYISQFSNFIDLQQEIKRLRTSKFELIESTNNEINDMRDTIKLLMNRITYKINPNSTMIIKQKQNQKQKQKHKHEIDIDDEKIINKNDNKYIDELLHNYCKLGKDNVVNIMVIGTKCSGKTVLLRNIMRLYNKEDILIKNAEYKIINCIISSIYNILLEYEFFQSDKYLQQLNLSNSMKEGIEYFRKNRLSKYDGPFLTEIVVKHINNIFSNSTEIISDTNDDNEFVRLAFMNHCFYRNMYYFYHNIDKYCNSNWYKNEFSTQELLLIWDTKTLPIYYYDIQLDINTDIIYRFWDISSDVLYNANIKYENNIKNLFEYINASCILYLTSPVFNYQIEKELNSNKIDETSMRKSMKYFQCMFEKNEKTNVFENENENILNIAKNKWELTPIITLFNKCDVFKMDIESLWDESKTILLTFPEYDGEQKYDSIINYIKIIFKSFNMYHKRPFHIYETVVIDDDKVKTIIHHIKTMTNLYTTNKRFENQNNKNKMSLVM